MPAQILDRSVQGIIDQIEGGNIVSFDSAPSVARVFEFKVPGNVIQLTNVIGRYYLPFDTTFTDARFFVATGSCSVSLSVNGTSDFLLNNESVTTAQQTVNLADRIVDADDFLQLDVVTAASGTTDLTMIVRATMPFASLLVQP